MVNILEEYEKSEFYSKYKNTYFSDAIMKDVIQKEIRKHNICAPRREDKYKYVFGLMSTVMEDFIKDYAGDSVLIDDPIKWRMLYSMYIDPDAYSVRKRNSIECTADGLLSIRRIYQRLGLSLELVEEYKKYRKTPIFHFPREKGGINTSRATTFGDRIDHTLYDLKRYCEGADDCWLSSAYSRPKTAAWIASFGRDFKAIIDWLGVKGVFVSENYEIFDLEYNDGRMIEGYAETYSWNWSDNYYNSIKAKIQEYENRSLDKK